jgi:glyoxylase-like metal-dependent hydrolase (beta-lactamase superfamily II)
MRATAIAASLAFALALEGAWAAEPAGPAPGETLSQSYRGSQRDNLAYQKIPPIKLFDNLFYVGPGNVSVWLIPTSAGLILVDTTEEPYVDHVFDSIRKVGYDPRNIKNILITHGHLDHFGGAARIQQETGARLLAVERIGRRSRRRARVRAATMRRRRGCPSGTWW